MFLRDLRTSHLCHVHIATGLLVRKPFLGTQISARKNSWLRKEKSTSKPDLGVTAHLVGIPFKVKFQVWVSRLKCQWDSWIGQIARRVFSLLGWEVERIVRINRLVGTNMMLRRTFRNNKMLGLLNLNKSLLNYLLLVE